VAHVAHTCFAPLSWSGCHHLRYPCQSANFHYNLRGASLFELMDVTGRKSAMSAMPSCSATRAGAGLLRTSDKFASGPNRGTS
jgi:hypothetical protein